MYPSVANSQTFQANEVRLFVEDPAARKNDKKEGNRMANISLMIMG
jgi:hypothetical protein